MEKRTRCPKSEPASPVVSPRPIPPGTACGGYLAVAAAALTLMLATACTQGGATPVGGKGATPVGASAVVGPVFHDVAAATGLDFTYTNGLTGQHYHVETVGAGGALVDYDGDGDLDVFLVQGHPLDPPGAKPATPGAAYQARLFRNDLTVGADGKRTLHFTDVTAASGIDARGFGMAVAAGDYDNDGWPDLYVANWGSNQLWHNNGDGTFTDVTAKSGTDDPRWSSGASFVDYDRDGWLDLVVVNYNRYNLADDHPCFDMRSGMRDYCGPSAYPSQPSSLFRNRGDGTFEDVTASTGFSATYGPALGVVATDINRDGWPDILVTNDGQPNGLWINEGGKKFRDEAMLRGVAVNRAGAAEANMGVVAADMDSDCDDDVFITHLNGETNTLWANDGTGVFTDETPKSSLGPVSLPFTGFGVADLDFDNDGLPDLFVANGDVRNMADSVNAGDPWPLKQTNQLFHNLGGGRFEDVTGSAGDFIKQPAVGRAVAMGDLDNDGASDLLVTYENSPTQLLMNNGGHDAHWLGLRLVGKDGRRDMYGAEVTVDLADGRKLCRRVRADGSYAVAQDPRVLFGLGSAGQVATVHVRWPDGQRESFPVPAPGQYHTLRQGGGSPVTEP
jgi:hypothetical protein